MSIKRRLIDIELADGRELTVETANPDHIQWELTAAKQNYPTVKVQGDDVIPLAPQLMMTFLAWAAAVRTGQLDMKWPEFFATECVGIEPQDEADVDPTQPGPSTG